MLWGGTTGNADLFNTKGTHMGPYIHYVTDSLCVIVCTYFTTVSVSEGTIIIFTLFLSLLATSLPTTYHKLDVALLA